VVKRAGDGILVQFRSVVEAIRCAVKLQNGHVRRKIELRVGICLADVVQAIRESSAAMTVTVAVKT
jgi:adenylate cyclase